MQQFGYFAFLTFLAYVASKNCDKHGVLLYEDLACQPQKTEDSCPTSYECGNLTAPGKCVVRGKTYNSGKPIETNSTGFSCEFGCFCIDSGDQHFTARISCAQWTCGEYSGLPTTPGCYRGYNLEYCCSSGEICPPFNDTTKCLVDGKEYKAGERFVPKDSCHVCLCQKGFNGKMEFPYCKRSGCDAQTRNQAEVQNYCAPVYFKSEESEKKCCPTTWTCPDGSEVVKSGNKKSELTCKYGKTVLQMGDYFEKEIKHLFRLKMIKCECKIPPLLTCNTL